MTFELYIHGIMSQKMKLFSHISPHYTECLELFAFFFYILSNI